MTNKSIYSQPTEMKIIAYDRGKPISEGYTLASKFEDKEPVYDATEETVTFNVSGLFHTALIELPVSAILAALIEMGPDTAHLIDELDNI